MSAVERPREEEVLKDHSKFREWAQSLLGKKVVYGQDERAYYQYKVTLPNERIITAFISCTEMPHGCGVLAIDLKNDMPDGDTFRAAARQNAKVLGFRNGLVFNVREAVGVQTGERIGDFSCNCCDFDLVTSVVLTRIPDDHRDLRYRPGVPEEVSVAIVASRAQEQLGSLLGWKIEPTK